MNFIAVQCLQMSLPDTRGVNKALVDPASATMKGTLTLKSLQTDCVDARISAALPLTEMEIDHPKPVEKSTD
ncbi:hypothetical protein ACLOJK_021570 [Asimina triloba]